ELTNFSTWRTWVTSFPNDAVESTGVLGNIGDRDAMSFDGVRYRLVEGQLVKSDFGSWRPFLFNWLTGAKQLDVRTDGGSKAFANPTFTRLNDGPTGGPTIVVTLFLPQEGAAPGEAGELIYYKKLDATPQPPPSPDPCENAGSPPAIYKHVIWIVFENKGYGSVIGSP